MVRVPCTGRDSKKEGLSELDKHRVMALYTNSQPGQDKKGYGTRDSENANANGFSVSKIENCHSNYPQSLHSSSSSRSRSVFSFKEGRISSSFQNKNPLFSRVQSKRKRSTIPSSAGTDALETSWIPWGHSFRSTKPQSLWLL